MNVEQIQLAIMRGNFTNDDLNAIGDSIRYKRGQLTKDTKRSLKVGDTVKFHNSRSGFDTVGTVTKIAIKYITVRDSQKTVGGLWRVPANMLSKVEA